MLLQKEHLKNLKPGVDRKVHLLAAALLWTVVGTVMIVRGWIWIRPTENILFLPAAFGIGTLKSVLVLDRAARNGVRRIARLRDGTCLGAVYSWKTWLLVAVMISSGILLRTFFDPGKYIGTLYCAVGWALLFSSRFGWQEWSRWERSKT